MLKIVDIRGEVPGSSSHLLRGVSEDGTTWAIRLHKVGKNAKRLFNEYAASKLAQSIGLNKPSAEVVYIPKDVLPKLNPDVFRNKDQFGIGTKFIEGVSKLNTPEDWDPNAQDFPEKNANLIHTEFPDSDSIHQLYGYQVFSSWIQIEDQKMEDLQVQENGSPVFLDFDVSLGGCDMDCELQEYLWWRLKEVPVFLVGVLRIPELFASWIQRIKGVDPGEFLNIINTFTQCFHFDRNCALDISEFLFSERERFLNEYEQLTGDSFE